MSEIKKVMYAGADWLKRDARKEVSPFGEQVADLLGYVFKGIYHIERPVMKADFTGDWFVQVTLGQRDLSTYDSNALTELVFLAHWMRIRLEIVGAAPGYVRLNFSRRMCNTGNISTQHPSLDEAVRIFKNRCGIDEVIDAQA